MRPAAKPKAVRTVGDDVLRTSMVWYWLAATDTISNCASPNVWAENAVTPAALKARRIVATTCAGDRGVPEKTMLRVGPLLSARSRLRPLSPENPGGEPVAFADRRTACSATSASVFRIDAPVALVVRTSTSCLHTPTTQGTSVGVMTVGETVWNTWITS